MWLALLDWLPTSEYLHRCHIRPPLTCIPCGLLPESFSLILLSSLHGGLGPFPRHARPHLLVLFYPWVVRDVESFPRCPKKEQLHGWTSCKSKGGVKTSHRWWHGGSWSNSYKINSIHPTINRSSTINLNNACQVRGLWWHTQRSSTAFHRGTNYQWQKSNKSWSTSTG